MSSTEIPRSEDEGHIGEVLVSGEELPPPEGPDLDLEMLEQAVSAADQARSSAGGDTPKQEIFDVDPDEDHEEIHESVVSRLDAQARHYDILSEQIKDLVARQEKTDATISNLSAMIAAQAERHKLTGNLQDSLSDLHSQMRKMSAELNERSTHDQKLRHLAEIKHKADAKNAGSTSDFSAEKQDPPAELITTETQDASAVQSQAQTKKTRRRANVDNL